MESDILVTGIAARCLICPEGTKPFITKNAAKFHVLKAHAKTREIRRHPKRYIQEVAESKQGWLGMLTAMFKQSEAEKAEKQAVRGAVGG
jgi:hypothetical protein